MRIHHALSAKESLRMARWSAQRVRSDVDAPSPSCPEALLPHNLPKTQRKPLQGHGLKIEH